MDKLIEGLSLVEEVNGLIENLQESLELFKKGEEESALARISETEKGIDDLGLGELPEREEIAEKLAEARKDLEWVTENANRVSGKSVDERSG